MRVRGALVFSIWVTDDTDGAARIWYDADQDADYYCHNPRRLIVSIAQIAGLP